MNQSRLESFVEAILGTALGFVVATVAQLIIFPRYGIERSIGVHLEIVGWFTLVGIIRTYIVRRWFNAGLHRAAIKIASSILKKVRRIR